MNDARLHPLHALPLAAMCAWPLACADLDPADADLAELDEIVANLRAAGYPEAEIEQTDDGKVIVGGDAEVTLEGSREMAGTEALNPEGFRQYRTAHANDGHLRRLADELLLQPRQHRQVDSHRHHGLAGALRWRVL